MKFKIDNSLGGVDFSVSIEGDKTDPALPARKLVLGRRVRFVNGDRLAVALTLIFWRLVSSELQFEPSVSPAVQLQIQQFLAPRKVICGPVDHNPRAIPIGTRTMAIGEAYKDGHDVEFRVLNTHAFASYESPTQLHVVSNAVMFDTYRMGARNPLLNLGLAVLCSDDFDVLRIEAPIEALSASSAMSLNTIALLRSVNLLLSIVSD